MIAGAGTAPTAGTTALSAKPPVNPPAITRCPILCVVTSGPTASISPANSDPGENGSGGLT